MRWCLCNLRSICTALLIGGASFSAIALDVDCVDCENQRKTVLRSTQLPENISESNNACYHTGYVQALLDMHFLDCQCHVIVDNHVAFLFCLPSDCVISDVIVEFIKDLPFISKVEICDGSYEEFRTKYLHQTSKNSRLPKQRALGTEIIFGKEGIWLPQNTILFSPLIADPRQVTNSAGIRFDDDVVGSKVGSAIFGGDFIFLRLMDISRFHGDLDIGIQGGVFSVFDLEHPDACMVNSDFFVSGLLGFAVNSWSYRLRLWHLSSHLGDEFLLSNPTFKRYNLSDEGIDCFISWRYNPQIRFYGGLGYIISRDFSFPEKPFYCEWGVELRPFGMREANIHAQPIFAMHFRMWEEHNFSVDQTYILGMEWSKFQGIGRKIRAFFEYHQGFSREGQFIRDRSDYYGFRVSYGF